MSVQAQRPFRCSRSHTIRVEAVDTLGEPIVLEVQSEEWLNAKTGRYHRVFAARQVGRLGWDTASSVREALKRAAYVPDASGPGGWSRR